MSASERGGVAGGGVWAVKAQTKAEIVKGGAAQVGHVLREREMLAACDHPFVGRLAASLMDEHSLYMVRHVMQCRGMRT